MIKFMEEYKQCHIIHDKKQLQFPLVKKYVVQQGQY